jgi:hypothetical protein
MLVLAMEFSRSAPHRQPETRVGGAHLASGRTDTSDIAVGTTSIRSLPQNGTVRSDTLAGPRSGRVGHTRLRRDGWEDPAATGMRERRLASDRLGVPDRVIGS